MWSAIFTGIMVSGGMCAFAAWQGTSHITLPDGITEDTPVREWPKEHRRTKWLFDVAKHRSRYLIGGLILFGVGLAGVVIGFVQTLQTATAPQQPSRSEFISVVADNPDNGYDRDEVTCIFDLMDESGIDMTADNGDRDEFIREFVAATAQMNDAQLERLDGCFDEDTRAARGQSMTDEELRMFLISVLSADLFIETETAECIVDILEERDLLREVLRNGTESSPAIDNAILEAGEQCP